MELLLTIQIEGTDVPCGRLFQNVRHGVETASFNYLDSYLADPRAFALAPDLPLVAGGFHSEGLAAFRALGDCMPDRWGRNLMLRAERNEAREGNRAARTLFDLDFLVGVSDETRQGAIRVWDAGGEAPRAAQSVGVPREVDIPSLLSSADRAATSMDADVRDLLAAGSSLGGARPKASVRDERGRLCIAKFPKADEDAYEDVGAWEHVTLQLMERAGIQVPRSRLLRVGGRSVLLLERFDRAEGGGRVPYISGISAVQGRDGENYSYLDLVEFLEQEGARPGADIRELWARALFSCAVGNTDNHMRNQGFLHGEKGWVLSPAFDVNPTPGDQPKFLNTSVAFDDRSADPALALANCEYFRMSRDEGRSTAHRMAGALEAWRKLALADGISKASIDAMAPCFESGIERLRAL